MADPHHHAACDDQRGGGEPELLGAEQHADDHVAGRLQPAVDLHLDLLAEPVQPQRLLGLGEPQLPGLPGVLERGERRRAGAPVVAGDDDLVGVRLGDAGRDRADARGGHQLDRHVGSRVGVAQVVDQLLEILDGVDVVVRRRRDQPDTRGGVPGLGDPRVDLVAGQLATLAGLGALRHLDLDLPGVHQVGAGHPEPAGGDLLDRGPADRVEQPVDILAALAGVRLAAEPVHRDGQRLVRLDGDGAVRHRAGDEPLHDLGRRLDLVERNARSLVGAQLEQPAQRGALAGQLVDGLGVPAEHGLLLARGWRAAAGTRSPG